MQNDLKFSGSSPVTINYNGSPDDIYAPVRTSSCDVNIVSASILDDLYSAKKNEICVRVKKGNTTIWEGYKMPNTYTQEVTLGLDSIGMTCIDPVSILKYIKVNKLFQKPNIVTYKTLIGKALSYVMLDANKLWVERTVSYNGSYSGTNGLLDLTIQVSNFWDEDGESCTVYDMISEMLRPFCMTLVFYNQTYQIYNPNKTTGTRRFDKYTIATNGNLTLDSSNQSETKATGLYEFSSDEWKSNNVVTPSVDINTTYEKVTGTVSTMVPSYGTMAIDLINYNNRNLYDYGQLNVQRNKTKGYVKRNGSVTTDTNDYWYYLWNGTYTNTDYGLRDNGLLVNWYLNCNQAYAYLTGTEGHPYNWGSVLNFYGGCNNPDATGKTQSTERNVNVHKRITAYAADNGTPAEFLELSDLDWSGHVNSGELTLNKKNTSNTKFGTGLAMSGSNRVIYHQVYENVNLNMSNNAVVNVDMTRSFSRTGIDMPIRVMNNNTTTGNTYNAFGNFTGCDDAKYYPQPWNAENIVVNSIYFRRYAGSGTIRVQPVWDTTRVDIYVTTSGSTIYQFNGEEWIQDTQVRESNSFYLKKLMNFEHLFHTDQRYNLIETGNGHTYSLNGEVYKYYTDNNGYVYESENGTAHEFQPYNGGLFSDVIECSDGYISIQLPQVSDTTNVIVVDIYNSSMLGMTGSGDVGGSYTGSPFYYANGGGEYTGAVYIDYLPINLTYVKGEHVDLDIEVTVPKSNLGQVFSESDIKYELNSNNDYVEEFGGPSFQVNTYNELVSSSFSYLIYNNAYADPTLFTLSSYTGRPESYTVQAYFNWLSKIRKIYTKTLVPVAKSRPFSNVRCYLKSPEVGSNELLVVKDSWDVKTNRHTVTAVEDNDLEVSTVGTVDVMEIPRRARAERWNLPTAQK